MKLKDSLQCTLKNTLPLMTTTNPHFLLPRLFPDEVIFRETAKDSQVPYTMKAFLEFCCSRNHLAPHLKTWLSCPVLTRPDQEALITAFVLSFTAKFEHFTSFPITCYWTSQNKNSSMPGTDSQNKPDIVCLDAANLVDFRSILTILEVKSSTMTKSEIFQLCAQRARLIFSSQDTRRFVVTSLLHREELTIVLFDRGGSIVCSPFNIHNEPDTFARFVLGFLCTAPPHLGYNPSVQAGATHNLMFRHLQLHIKFTPFISIQIHGRGTVIWLAEVGPQSNLANIRPEIGLKDGDPVVITEGIILSLLAGKGVQGAPVLIYEDSVLQPCDGEQPNGTTYLQGHLGFGAKEANVPDGNIQLSKEAVKDLPRESMACMEGFALCTPVRMLSKPWGTPITCFRSARELLGVIIDVLTSMSILKQWRLYSPLFFSSSAGLKQL